MLVFWSQEQELKYSPLMGSFPDNEIKVYCSTLVPVLNKGDLLIVMGGDNLKTIQNMGWLPKNRTIGKLREQVHAVKGNTDFLMMVTYDINVESYDYTSFVKLQTDLNLVRRYHTTGSLKPKIGKYVYVENYSKIPYLINDLYNKHQRPVRLALDLETVGLFPFYEDKFIVSISISFVEGESHVIRFKGVKDQPKKSSDLWDEIHWLLNDDRISIVGANLKFDLIWIRKKWRMTCSNFKLDTTLVGSMLDENRSNSLNTHTKLYIESLGGYDDEFNRTQDKSRMDLVSSKNLLPYAGGDTDAGLRVANKMAKELSSSKSQTQFYIKLLHPASRAFEDMEYTGVLVDVPYFKKLQKQLFKDMAKLELQAKDLMPKRILSKYDGEFALSKSAIIKDFMFSHPKGLRLKPKMKTAKTGEPSTAFDHLKMFDDDPEAKEFVEILKAWTSAKKTESTYITGFLKHLREDGRFHPTAILYRGDYGGKDGGTVTGRLAFKDPAAQTLPKHTSWAKRLRMGYIAPPGYKIIQWDYSQGELRVIACVADEATMIQAYMDGIDMHLKTGAELNNLSLAKALKMMASTDKDVLEKVGKIRQGGKAGNFGLIYGISPEGYVEYARNTYGVVITLAEATFQQEAFFEMYPGIGTYHKKYKQMAHKNGFVQSPLGRVRHLPLIHSNSFKFRGQAERQAINSPIQSTLSDMACLTLAEHRARHGYAKDCKFFMMTHDAVAAYVREDRVEYWRDETKDIMENLPLKEYFNWEPELQFIVDAEIGNSLATLEKF